MGSMSTFLRTPFSKDGLKCINFLRRKLDEIHIQFKQPSLLTTTTVTQIGFTGGFLIPLPSWEAKGYDTIMFRGPATSLRLPLTHSELSLETINVR